MSKQIINIGAAPNDGTGDTVRESFAKTKSNFDEIYAAGPVGSNITISGNTISTTNVNGDLTLNPYGIGNIKLNNNTVPQATNTYNLGSPTLRWNTVYSTHYSGNGAGLTGIVAESSIGTATKLINGLSEVNIADSDGVIYANVDGVTITVIGSDGVSVAGNVTSNYFIGDGSQLTGIGSSINKIFNGNSSANIDTADGNLVVNINDNSWTFDANGNLTTSGNTVIQSSGGIEYPVNGEWDLHRADGKVYIGSVSDMAYIDTYDANISVRLRTNGENENAVSIVDT